MHGTYVVLTYIIGPSAIGLNFSSLRLISTIAFLCFPFQAFRLHATGSVMLQNVARSVYTVGLASMPDDENQRMTTAMRAAAAYTIKVSLHIGHASPTCHACIKQRKLCKTYTLYLATCATLGYQPAHESHS